MTGSGSRGGDFASDRPGSDDERLPIKLTIPAETRLLRLARMAAATVAVDLGFNLSDIEDVRVAVDELAAMLIDGAPEGAVLDLCFGLDSDALLVEGELRDGVGPAPQLHPVAQELLDLVADEYMLTTNDRGSPAFRLRKRSRGIEE